MQCAVWQNTCWSQASGHEQVRDVCTQGVTSREKKERKIHSVRQQKQLMSCNVASHSARRSRFTLASLTAPGETTSFTQRQSCPFCATALIPSLCLKTILQYFTDTKPTSTTVQTQMQTRGALSLGKAFSYGCLRAFQANGRFDVYPFSLRWSRSTYSLHSVHTNHCGSQTKTKVTLNTASQWPMEALCIPLVDCCLTFSPQTLLQKWKIWAAESQNGTWHGRLSQQEAQISLQTPAVLDRLYRHYQNCSFQTQYYNSASGILRALLWLGHSDGLLPTLLCSQWNFWKIWFGVWLFVCQGASRQKLEIFGRCSSE